MRVAWSVWFNERMKLMSYEVQTVLGRFERIGALAHGAIVDLNAACAALLAKSRASAR